MSELCRGAKAQLLQWGRAAWNPCHAWDLGPGPKPAGVLPATGPETLPAQSASSAGQSCCSQEVQGEAEDCNGMHDLGTVRSDAIARQTGHARLLTGLSGAAFSPLQPLASCARAPDVPQEGPTSHPAGASGGGWLPRQALWPYVHVPFLSHRKV